MKNIHKLLIATGAALATFLAIAVPALATSTLTVQQGGTGTTTAPISQLLYGGNSALTPDGRAYSSVATTSVTCSGSTSCTGFTVIGGSPITITSSGGGGTGLSTTSPLASSNLLVYSVAGAGAAYGVATTTLAGTGVITISNSPVLIGASPAVASLTGGSNGQVLAWLSGAPSWTASTTLSAGTAISISTAGSVTTVNNTGVTALAGTANQITSSGSTGSITLSIPSQFNISNASTTNFSANTAAVGGTATTTLAANGEITGNDITNSFLGRISPTRSFALQTGTTTTWTASTTGTGYSPSAIMPFAGTLKQVRCTPYIGASAGSFLGINVKVNGSDATPSYFIASSTVGTEKFTSGNTFTAGQTVLADFGTTTTATATSVTCTFDSTETP